MGLGRRQDIVRLCRAHDVIVIEDDVYSIFAEPQMLPLAALAPERTLYVSGLSRTLSPGSRIGVLAAPATLIESALSKLQATCSMASPIACMIMEQWLTDGTAVSVAASIRSDSARRLDLARSRLPSGLLPASGTGFHVWLSMPVEEAEHLARSAASVGVILMSPRASLVNRDAKQGGIRLSLGGPSMDALDQALTMVGSLLEQSRPKKSGAVATL